MTRSSSANWAQLTAQWGPQADTESSSRPAQSSRAFSLPHHSNRLALLTRRLEAPPRFFLFFSRPKRRRSEHRQHDGKSPSPHGLDQCSRSRMPRRAGARNDLGSSRALAAGLQGGGVAVLGREEGETEAVGGAAGKVPHKLRRQPAVSRAARGGIGGGGGRAAAAAVRHQPRRRARRVRV